MGGDGIQGYRSGRQALEPAGNPAGRTTVGESDCQHSAGVRWLGRDGGSLSVFRARQAVFVNVVVASLHAHCFNSARGTRSGLSQTSSFNSQLRVEQDQRRGLLALARAYPIVQILPRGHEHGRHGLRHTTKSSSNSFDSTLPTFQEAPFMEGRQFYIVANNYKSTPSKRLSAGEPNSVSTSHGFAQRCCGGLVVVVTMY